MSDQQTTDNFWQVWNTFEWPPVAVIFYRLYYNEDGSPKCYTMEDLPGKYVEIDQETYLACPWNVKVVNGKLEIITPASVVHKLKPNIEDGITCSPRDVCVVVDSDQPHVKWSMTNNEIY